MKNLVIKLTGEITKSNFDTWKKDLIKQIKSANKELVKDEDFAEAEDTVKAFKAAEKSLVEAKASALEQAADIQKLFSAIDEVSAEARDARLSLERQIKDRKAEIKTDLITMKKIALDTAWNEQDHDFKVCMRNKISEFYSDRGLQDAIKGKRTIETMESALESYADNAIDEIEAMAVRVAQCRDILDQVDREHYALFQDENVLLAMPPDQLESEIDKRIAVFEANELKRQAEETKQKAEAQARAEEEAKREAEREAAEQAPEPEPTQAPDTQARITSDDLDDFAPAATSRFAITVFVSGSRDEAVAVAQAINAAVGEDPAVDQIKLTNTTQSEAA